MGLGSPEYETSRAGAFCLAFESRIDDAKPREEEDATLFVATIREARSDTVVGRFMSCLAIIPARNLLLLLVVAAIVVYCCW